MISDRVTVVTPADHVPGPRQGGWTYNHYAALPDDGQRYEVVEGVLYMTPAPNVSHQSVVLRVAHYLLTYVEFAGLGKAYLAPVDVQLAPNVVVQPDVLVILNAHFERIITSRILGAPDLVVEVVSPGTASYDRHQKLINYERAGVAEYWIADPLKQTVEIFVLEAGIYHTLGTFQGKDTLLSQVVSQINAVLVEQFFT